MPSDVNFGVRRFISAFQSHVTMQLPIRSATFPCYYRSQTGCYVLCGWLRRATPPPDLPARLGTPADLRSTFIRGRGFAAYLSDCARQLLTVRCAHYVRLRHYRPSLLAAASNSLTFVHGADRACCAPRKWQCSLTRALPKWSWKTTKACARHCTPPTAAPCRPLNIPDIMRNHP